MNMFFIQTQSIVPFYKRLATRSIFPVFLSDNIGLNITSDKNIFFFPLATTIFIWNYPPFPLKNQKISNNAGEEGLETLSVRHFVFFLHRRGGLQFLIGLCPKGSLIKASRSVLSGLQTLGFASSF